MAGLLDSTLSSYAISVVFDTVLSTHNGLVFRL